MSAHAETGGSMGDRAAARAPGSASGALWLVLLALFFVAALGGSYLLVRGRIGSSAQPAVAPTAVAVATPARASSAPTALATPSTRASATTPASQPTLTSDQEASSYLWQQSHEQDFCSCNTANPPSSP